MSQAAQAVQRMVNEIRKQSRTGGEMAKAKRERKPKKDRAATPPREETPREFKKPKYRQLAINTEMARNVVLKGLQAVRDGLEGKELAVADSLISRIEARKGME